MTRNALLLICSLAISAMEATAADPTSVSEMISRLRTALEQQFRTSTGLGFSSFDCDPPPDSTAGREVTCKAVDEEGDRFFYRIAFGSEGGAPSVSTTQPLTQLATQGRETLERPCLAFLDAFERRAWTEAHRQLSAEFSKDFSTDTMETTLRPLRESLGDLKSVDAQTYGTPSPGLHQIEYALSATGGEAVARFQLRFDEGQARIVAFLVTARPGSALQARLLSAVGREMLTPLLGQPVVRITGPLADLERIGDSIEGQAILNDGTVIPLWIEQHNTAHDLDKNDYRFRVIHIPFLIRHYLVSTGADPKKIDCPSQVAPNGGRVDCVVTLADGSERAITVNRRDGDHRLLQKTE